MNERVGATLEALADVEVSVSARLGRAHVPLSQVLSLATGSIVSLDCLPDSPAVLLVNGVAVAEGELVVTDAGMLAIEIRHVPA
jgi:flagellar motor switch protein FliN